MAQHQRRKAKLAQHSIYNVCGVQLPHTDAEVQMTPRQVMPTLQFPAPEDPEAKWTVEMEARVKNLAANVDRTREETMELQQRLDQQKAKFKADAMARCSMELGGYLGPQPIKQDQPQVSEMRKLKGDLEHSKFLLAEARNRMHSLKQEIAAYQRILRQELGDHVNLRMLVISGGNTGWKGRAQVIQNLKLKNAALQEQLSEYQRKFPQAELLYDGPFDPRPATCVDDFVHKNQKKVLRKMYQDKKELLRKNEYELTAFMKEYESLGLLYKSAVARNKILADDLRSLKEQCQTFEMKSNEDNELIESLMSHQVQMRGMLDRETALAELTLRRCDDGEAGGRGGSAKGSEKGDKLDTQKYRTLWETSETEKQDLEDMVLLLQKRLDDVTRQVVEAERHCADNLCRSEELGKQLEVVKSAASKSGSAKSKDHAKGKPGKTKQTPSTGFLATYEQLLAVKAENKFLRDFLRKAIITKEDDFKLYQFSMNSARQQYLRAIEELKGGRLPPPQQ